MEITRLALFSEFVGQLHPLLIHFPIGILLISILLLFYQRFFKKDFQATISILFKLGCVFSGITCLAGWLLASSGEYNAEIIFFHRWSGISTFILTILICFFDRFRFVLAGVLFFFIMFTGHYGSILTYGEGYFSGVRNETSTGPEKVKPKPIKSAHSLVESPTYFYPYEDQIAPIFKSKCYSCHSIQKKKGGLRLDSEFFIKKGGKNGRILIAGNSLKSHLYTNLLLPEDDDFHMPPKGKRQLTPMEMQLIGEWISSGAPFGEVEQEIIVKSNERINSGFNLPKSDKFPLEDETEMEVLNQSENQVLIKLREAKISIVSSGGKSQWLSLNFINVKSDANKLLQEAKSIKMHILQVKLNNFNQIDFSQLKDFKNLKILHIGQTNLQDGDLDEFLGLLQLEQLNIFSTAISDVGLMKLADFPRLKVLYLWDTRVSEKGLKELKLKKPHLKIESGLFTFKLADTNLNKRLEIAK
jgi:uncharacterized membrane protein